MAAETSYGPNRVPAITAMALEYIPGGIEGLDRILGPAKTEKVTGRVAHALFHLGTLGFFPDEPKVPHSARFSRGGRDTVRSQN